jgi:hypothetical protein
MMPDSVFFPPPNVQICLGSRSVVSVFLVKVYIIHGTIQVAGWCARMYNFGELHLHVVFHESMEKPGPRHRGFVG